jgi:5,10-methylene-tetrahydrofolate dehydrogenase/methenyl tetrahydrofolate cyclohydrolase
VQAPLPRHISETKIFGAVAPEKDVDGFNPVNVGKLLLGDATGFRSCTPAGIHELLIRSGVKIEGAEVVILGRGNSVGKPLAAIYFKKRGIAAPPSLFAIHKPATSPLIAAARIFWSPLWARRNLSKPG